MSTGNWETAPPQPDSVEHVEREEPQEERVFAPEGGSERVFERAMERARAIGRRLLILGLVSQSAVSCFDRPATPRAPERAQTHKYEEPDRRELGEFFDGLYGHGSMETMLSSLSEQITERFTSENIEGYESLGLSPEQARTLFIETYPEHWVEGELRKITIKPAQKVSRFSEEAETDWAKSLNTEVELYSTDLRTISSMYSHELGHVNSWEEDDDASFVERARLLKAASVRLFKEQNDDTVFHTDYERGIIGDLHSKESERRVRIDEWWADVCRSYFDSPRLFKEEHPVEFSMVDEWVKKQDPDFDVFAEYNKREALLESITRSDK